MSTPSQSGSNGVSLIVGGSSGMGLETARLLRARGQDLVLVASNANKLDAARSELTEAPGGTIEIVSLDLYDQHAVDAFIQRLDGERRSIAHLVNAAGAFKPLSFLEHGPADYEKYMALNKATFFITQAVARNMKANSGGSIVNIGSMWAKQAIKATPPPPTPWPRPVCTA